MTEIEPYSPEQQRMDEQLVQKQQRLDEQRRWEEQQLHEEQVRLEEQSAWQAAQRREIETQAAQLRVPPLPPGRSQTPHNWPPRILSPY